jgi:hypothetical protein
MGQRKRKRQKERAKSPRKSPEAQTQSDSSSKGWRTQWPRLSLGKAARYIVGTLIFGALFPLYFQYKPSWGLDLPSASFRKNNPYTGVFTLTNLGYFPAANVSVQCLQKMIEYSDPPDTFSANLSSEPSTAHWISRNGKFSVTCPQMVAGVKVWNRALSDEEVKQFAQQGPPLNENPHIIWIDLVFTIRYSPITFLPFIHWTDTIRVKGEPSEGDDFVWMTVPVEQLYDRPSYRHWKERHSN